MARVPVLAREAQVPNPYYNLPGSAGADAAYGIPPVMAQRQPYATLAYVSSPGGVSPLIGYPSVYPHVINQTPAQDYRHLYTHMPPPDAALQAALTDIVMQRLLRAGQGMGQGMGQGTGGAAVEYPGMFSMHTTGIPSDNSLPVPQAVAPGMFSMHDNNTTPPQRYYIPPEAQYPGLDTGYFDIPASNIPVPGEPYFPAGEMPPSLWQRLRSVNPAGMPPEQYRLFMDSVPYSLDPPAPQDVPAVPQQTPQDVEDAYQDLAYMELLRQAGVPYSDWMNYLFARNMPAQELSRAAVLPSALT